MSNLKNLYQLLGVDPKAPDFVVKAAYRAHMLNGGHEDVGGSFSKGVSFNKAKEVLLDPVNRAAYDKAWRKQNETQIGNYQVLEQIGEGGFGVTYKAREVTSGALACLKQNIHISSDDIVIMERESEILSRLHHHSLPGYRSFFRLEDGSCVLAMSYVEGFSLDKIVEKRRTEGKVLEPEHAAWMTQRLLNALNYMHYHGIVHGDVKPANIMIKAREHNAILVDFGFSTLRPKKGVKPEGYTEVFAAPEILSLKPPLRQSDLYSLGVTMIYALGGNPATHWYPDSVPKPMQEFFNEFLNPVPLKRPVWDKVDLVKKISTLRKSIFGRSQSSLELVV